MPKGGTYMKGNLVSFNFVPDINEQIEAIIKVPKEDRSVIHGIVKDSNDQIIQNAVVKLFRVENSTCIQPIMYTFTDSYGEFVFGPLCPHVNYLIKVWVNHIKIRELIITPDPCSDCINSHYKNFIDSKTL